MLKKIIPYGRQWIDNSDIKAVVEVLKSDRLTQGPKIEQFEKAISKYCKAKYAVAFSSGTTALFSAYKALGLKDGDEVITTPLTFAATSNMLHFCGAKPVFADVEEKTLNINPEEIIKKITKKTKAIAAVDFAGHPCDYDKILKIAKKNNIALIEDASHALGAEYKGRKAGSFSDMTILSFHPVKHIAAGEGGMVLTNNAEFYKKLKLIRNHGIVKIPEKGGWYYEIESPYFNFRITDMQCALGISQLKKINKFLKRRREIVLKYQKDFKNVPGIVVPFEAEYAKSSWHIFPIRTKVADRKKVFDSLRKMGLGVQVHYMPLHLHPFYQKEFGYKKGDFPIAEKYYEEAITIPLFPKMTSKDIKRVIQAVKKTINFLKK